MIAVCPKCDIALFILSLNSVEVDYCECCRGIWFDTGEWERLIQITGAQADDPLRRFQQRNLPKPRTGKHLCPRCDRYLEELVIEEVPERTLELDRCPRGHGLWFDADELQRLLAMYPPETSASKTIEYLNELFGEKSKT